MQWSLRTVFTKDDHSKIPPHKLSWQCGLDAPSINWGIWDSFPSEHARTSATPMTDRPWRKWYFLKHQALVPCCWRFLDPSHPVVRKFKIAHVKVNIEKVTCYWWSDLWCGGSPSWKPSPASRHVSEGSLQRVGSSSATESSRTRPEILCSRDKPPPTPDPQNI